MSPETDPARPDLIADDADQRELNRGSVSMDNHGEQEWLKAPSTSQLKCGTCQTAFRRPEHLKRHLRSHTKEKPFECSRCSRRFSRRDTLHRHDLSHHAPGLEGGLDRTHRITVKTFRACFNCAAARVRCSGGDQCVRCQSRSLRCRYPTERRSKLKTGKELNTRPSDSFIGNKPSEDGHPVVDHVSKLASSRTDGSQYQPQSGQIQFCFVRYDASSGQSDNSARRNRETYNQPAAHQSQNISDFENANQHPILPETEGTVDTQQPYSAYPDIDLQHSYHQASTPDFQLPFAGDSLAGPETNSEQAQPDINNNIDMDIEMANATNQQLPIDLSHNIFDQGGLSAINWLPTNLLSDTGSALPLGRVISEQPTQGLWSDSFNARTTLLPSAASAEQMNSYNEAQDMSEPYASDMLLREISVENPRMYSHGTQKTTPHSESLESSVHSGDYYVDGDGSRHPKYSRKRRAWSNSEEIHLLLQMKSSTQELPFAFPPFVEVGTDGLSNDVQSIKQINPATYEKIRHTFEKLCCTDVFFVPFETDHFPSAEVLSSFIQHYFDSFQPVYPIFHLPTFDPNQGHWILTMAVSAVGCHVINSPETAKCTSALNEFIRRAIQIEKEKYIVGPVPIWLLQAMLLNCIGLSHSSSARAKEFGFSFFGDLVRLSNREKLLSASSRSEPEGEHSWKTWVAAEVRRRTGYCIWLLDCTLAYAFDVPKLLSLDDAQAPLPSHENSWQAQSEDVWRRIYEHASNENASLYSATQILYIEKKLISGTGEFSHILLLHALYQRMWEVSDYFRRSLSCWDPTAEKQTRDAAIPSGSIWLPGLPIYSKWRNSACDCLDILHWTANGTIAKAAGLEHPTVLHLHAARIVLLVPFREMRALATSLAKGTLHWNEHEQAIEWHHIWRWVRYDQYKARLAIIHAGSVLWFVRRYSTSAFHEPAAVFLATLTLWAYGSCQHKVVLKQNNSRNGGDSEQLQPQPDVSEPTPNPTFIHLDRPCDDELVQLFVREGQTMRGNLTGVGDICGPHGPGRILKEGIRTLSGLAPSWAIAYEFIGILAQLGDQVPSPASTMSDGSQDHEM